MIKSHTSLRRYSMKVHDYQINVFWYDDFSWTYTIIMLNIYIYNTFTFTVDTCECYYKEYPMAINHDKCLSGWFYIW